MKYENARTGAIIETDCKISGKNWKEVVDEKMEEHENEHESADDGAGSDKPLEEDDTGRNGEGGKAPSRRRRHSEAGSAESGEESR